MEKVLAHGYRALQNWDKWLAQQYLGNIILETEKSLIKELLKSHYGKHALMVGVPQQSSLLDTTDIHHRTLATPIVSTKNKLDVIETSLTDLPIFTGTVDLAILPHTINFIDNPRQLLAELCRTIKPEGLIVVCTFNPYSAWSFKSSAEKKGLNVPAGCHFISPTQIKHWLQLADFVIEAQKSVLFRPPVQSEKLYNRLGFVERLGAFCLPWCGGVNLIVARAKVIPLTPIKMKWKQQLGNIKSVSPTVTGTLAGQKPVETQA